MNCGKTLVLLTIALLPLSSLAARAESRTITAKFMAWEQPTTGLYTTADGRTFTPVSAPAYRYGQSALIPAGTTLRLYQPITRDGETTYEVALEAPIPSGATQIKTYLLPRSRSASRSSYQAIVLPDDPQAFQSQQVRVFNFAPHTAAVKIGDEQFTLEPLASRVMTAKPDHKLRVITAMSMNVNGDWTGLGLQVLSVRPDHRADIVLIHTALNLDKAVATEDPELVPRALMLTETEYVPAEPTMQAAGANHRPR